MEGVGKGEINVEEDVEDITDQFQSKLLEENYEGHESGVGIAEAAESAGSELGMTGTDLLKLLALLQQQLEEAQTHAILVEEQREVELEAVANIIEQQQSSMREYYTKCSTLLDVHAKALEANENVSHKTFNVFICSG